MSISDVIALVSPVAGALFYAQGRNTKQAVEGAHESIKSTRELLDTKLASLTDRTERMENKLEKNDDRLIRIETRVLHPDTLPPFSPRTSLT